MKSDDAAEETAAVSPLTVLVIAHPDDESMFFVPTIHALQRHRQRQRNHHQLWLLCLTTGNYDGLGQVRCQELISTTRQVFRFDRVLLCDDDQVQDHPRLAWDTHYVAQLIKQTIRSALHEETFVKLISSIQLITFDELGVSRHINHRDTYLACRQLVTNDDTEIPHLELWTLRTDTNPLFFFRYTPVLSWALLLLTWCRLWPQSTTRYHHSNDKNNHPENTYRCITNRLQYPSLNWHAMASHRSQFVWYRRLFVVFSCYTYVNRLERHPYTNTVTSVTTATTVSKKNR